jgi:poly(A) polymerase
LQDILTLLHSNLPSGLRNTTYLVGGYIRDRIMGYIPDDIDLVVEGQAREAAHLVASILSGSVIELDPSRSIYRVVLNGRHIDLEGAGTGNLMGNLEKRDFTINALVLPLSDSLNTNWQKCILDPYDGLGDIRSQIVRAVSRTAMEDDPLRCLRAFRIAGKLGFTIEPGTLAQIRQSAHLIKRCAGERIWEELAEILSLEKASSLLRLMDSETALFESIFPEIIPLKGLQQGGFHQEDAWVHSLNTLECVESLIIDPPMAPQTFAYLQEKLAGSRTRLTVFKLAALLHDIGKPNCQVQKSPGRFSFHGHDQVGGQIVSPIAHRLKMSNREADLLKVLVKEHMAPLTLYTSSPTARALRRLFLRLGQDTVGVLLLSLADYMATRNESNEAIEAYRDYVSGVLSTFITRGDEYTKRAALLNGYEIAEILDTKPSPIIGQAIEALADAEFDGIIATKEQAIVFLLHWAANLDDSYQG